MQVQGLMDIFDRDWCNLYVWTVNGSTVFHIPRDREYWGLCFQALAEFWWRHVVPAKHALAGDNSELADLYRYGSSQMCCVQSAPCMHHTNESAA